MLIVMLFTLGLFVLALAYQAVLSARLIAGWATGRSAEPDHASTLLARSVQRATQELSAIFGLGDD